jgi:hypothetical protein
MNIMVIEHNLSKEDRDMPQEESPCQNSMDPPDPLPKSKKLPEAAGHLNKRENWFLHRHRTTNQVG